MFRKVSYKIANIQINIDIEKTNKTHKGASFGRGSIKKSKKEEFKNSSINKISSPTPLSYFSLYTGEFETISLNLLLKISVMGGLFLNL